MKGTRTPTLQSLLLQWFRKNKRSLPWRRTRDPYKIWISEIMLQQTQVKTVLPYYRRWVKRFPNLNRLARAPLPQVLKLWEGLGYYRRARNLHRASKFIVEKLGGKFPNSAQELRKLPGVGRYTAGAVASIAFGKPEPILDGNVKRVLARLFAVKEPVDTALGEKKLWKVAERLVVGARARAGDFNQSLMELGALVCLPENPKCGVCPLEKLCAAHRLRKETEFPVKSKRERVTKLRTVAAVIWKNGRVLLQRQPLQCRWGGLWTFPHWKTSNGKKDEELLKEGARELLAARIRDWKPRGELRHGFTKYHVRLRVYEGQSRGRQKAKGSWIKPEKLTKLALPRPHRKIADLLVAS